MTVLRTLLRVHIRRQVVSPVAGKGWKVSLPGTKSNISKSSPLSYLALCGEANYWWADRIHFSRRKNARCMFSSQTSAMHVNLVWNGITCMVGRLFVTKELQPLQWSDNSTLPIHPWQLELPFTLESLGPQVLLLKYCHLQCLDGTQRLYISIWRPSWISAIFPAINVIPEVLTNMFSCIENVLVAWLGSLPWRWVSH
jgi:hypothetical protein